MNFAGISSYQVMTIQSRHDFSATFWLGEDSGVEPLDHIPNSQVKRMSRRWYLVVMTSESRLSPSLQVALDYFRKLNPPKR